MRPGRGATSAHDALGLPCPIIASPARQVLWLKRVPVIEGGIIYIGRQTKQPGFAQGADAAALAVSVSTKWVSIRRIHCRV